jgi:hypothetical protein
LSDNATQLEELCLAQKTKALVVVFSRGMEECFDQTMFDTAVLPGLVRLIFSALNRCGIEFEDSQEAMAEESIQSLLKQTRKVVMMKPMDEDNNNNYIADKVASFIVSRLAEAMEEAKYGLETSILPTVKIPFMTAKSPEIQVSSLIFKRETQRQAAKRASQVARSSMDKILQTGENISDSIANESPSLLNGTLICSTLQLVDEATKARFDARKMQLDQLKAQVQEGESEKIKNFRVLVNELESERLNVQERIAELKATIQTWEAKDEELTLKIDTLVCDIVEEEKFNSEQAKKIQEQILKAKEETRYGNLVESLSGMMKAYAKNVEAATTKSIQAVQGSILPAEMASNKMETYLQLVLDYFQIERECLNQLKTRLEANTCNVASLKLELEQVAGLGMITTTNQIEDAISSKEEMIENDSKMLVGFTGEATAMLDELVSRLQTYSAALKGAEDLHPIHYDLLVEIKTEIDDSGISGSDKLKKFIPESRAASPVVMTEFTNTTASSVATPSPLANEKKMKKVAGAEGLPKLTWATLAPKPSSEKKTSLLAIQKEELEAKK